MEKVTCPYCGYQMPIRIAADAVAKGLYVKCKGRNCGQTFEIKIPEEKTK